MKLSTTRNASVLEGVTTAANFNGINSSRAPALNLLVSLFAFLVPAMMIIEIFIVGRLFLAEILLLAALPLLLITRGKLLYQPLPKRLIILGIAWLVAQIVTDVFRGTPFEDFSRGWSKIIFVMTNFVSIYLLLIGHRTRIILFALGLALSQLIAFYTNPSELAIFYPWKFGIGMAVTATVIVASQLRAVSRVVFLPELLAAAIGLINLYMGFRSLAAICLLAAIYTVSQRLTKSRSTEIVKIGAGKIVWVAGLLLLGAFLVVQVYSWAAREGILGEAAHDLFNIQSKGDLGLLLGGRIELLASSLAIKDSPVIGHGSWARDPKYVALLNDQLSKYDYEIDTTVESDQIPTHSYLFGAWVESGLMGAIFWGFVLFVACKLLLFGHGIRLPLGQFVAFGTIGLIWNILFSPLGAEGRISAAFYIVLVFYAWDLMVRVSRPAAAAKVPNEFIVDHG